MTYDLIWHERLKEDLSALNKEAAARMLVRIKERLARDPLGLSKPLKGIFKGLYRYRMGDHRIIFAVDHEKRRLIILHVKHGKDAYR